MDTASTLARHYLDAWNERDAPARRARVARLFTLDARYVDPMMAGAGHDGIDALIAAAQQHFPEHRFALHGTPDAHHDVLRFGWTLHGPDGAEVVRGMDVATLGSDGRLASVAGFLDTAA
ncbi:nuclear transport factor 2 family protein [Massilia sp. IC2-278]|uniref:nuclear transport factor 2 family protein n=1 Tax=Massilia sp. IC2-278 TaxID=2887200 RepID=UPI001E4079AA|nr:nuclear transport factor 2 family protein [Massilia sp. IC2-278]MCC2960476.1 nuclear transport factor 2 family protein [Massilia sp. IC2-278]